MRMKTLNKRRKFKLKEEELINQMIKRYKAKRNDLKKNCTWVVDQDGKRSKVFICVDPKTVKSYEKARYPIMMPYFYRIPEGLFINREKPFGELEHPSVIRNEN